MSTKPKLTVFCPWCFCNDKGCMKKEQSPCVKTEVEMIEHGVFHANDMTSIPAAACGMCGGWTGFGGMSQYAESKIPVHGRTGCFCRGLGFGVGQRKG